MSIQIDLEKCTGCGSCVPVCPFGVMELVNDKARVKDSCNLCGACVDACTFDAIKIEKAEQQVSEGYKGVWVFAERIKSDLHFHPANSGSPGILCLETNQFLHDSSPKYTNPKGRQFSNDKTILDS